jgi:glycosyltransferase involved in cell wall biosynthesis
MGLRVAHVANESFGVDSANGVQHVVHWLAQAQAEIGESVAVFTRDDHGMRVFGSDFDPVSNGRGLSRSGTHKSIRQRLLARYFDPTVAQDLLAWRPDVVHFHSVHIPENVALAGRLGCAGIPYCLTIHGGLFPAALQRRALKKAIFQALFERRYLNEALFIHALSQREATIIERHGVSRPIVVLPNGLPPDSRVRATQPDALYAKHPWLRDRRVFMFIGRLDAWQKGLDLVVKAFAQASLADSALVLVGPDYRGSQNALRLLANRLGVLPQLIFMEPAFGEHRANLLAAADVFIHPSRWEGMSLSVLAASAAGKPCLITRDADPLGELERAHAAFIVDATVTSVAAGLIQACCLGREDLQAMGARALRVAEAHFTWPSIATRMGDAYRRAIRSERP